MKSLTKACIAILLTVSIALFGFQSYANAQTKANLLIGPRPGAPYNALPRYNEDLTQTGTDPNKFPVEVTRHHIVPFNQLTTLWDGMADRGFLSNSIKPLRDSINSLLSSSNPPNGINLNSADRTQIIQLLDDILAKKIVHDRNSTFTPPGLDSFRQVYSWIPGNLFIGPSNRSDDPGEGFETNASIVVNNTTNWNKLTNTNTSITTFNNNPTAGNAQTATNNYSAIITKRNEPYPLNANNWVRGNDGRYRLR
ncbi:MAG: hypothetical protein F6K62_21770 [Sphaerospermopsis sp. SIO1G2]|nr:hypothetical protein [Sphaerospermopsis sp. SIO1G1]NET73467.1 hypothetical protein [Sphaerospermopsis sp. SIO1G2]